MDHDEELKRQEEAERRRQEEEERRRREEEEQSNQESREKKEQELYSLRIEKIHKGNEYDRQIKETQDSLTSAHSNVTRLNSEIEGLEQQKTRISNQFQEDETRIQRQLKDSQERQRPFSEGITAIKEIEANEKETDEQTRRKAAYAVYKQLGGKVSEEQFDVDTSIRELEINERNIQHEIDVLQQQMNQLNEEREQTLARQEQQILESQERLNRYQKQTAEAERELQRVTQEKAEWQTEIQGREDRLKIDIDRLKQPREEQTRDQTATDRQSQQPTSDEQ